MTNQKRHMSTILQKSKAFLPASLLSVDQPENLDNDFAGKGHILLIRLRVVNEISQVADSCPLSSLSLQIFPHHLSLLEFPSSTIEENGGMKRQNPPPEEAVQHFREPLTSSKCGTTSPLPSDGTQPCPPTQESPDPN